MSSIAFVVGLVSPDGRRERVITHVPMIYTPYNGISLRRGKKVVAQQKGFFVGFNAQRPEDRYTHFPVTGFSQSYYRDGLERFVCVCVCVCVWTRKIKPVIFGHGEGEISVRLTALLTACLSNGVIAGRDKALTSISQSAQS